LPQTKQSQLLIYQKGDMDVDDIRRVLMSWMGYAKHADSYWLIHKILNQFTFTK